MKFFCEMFIDEFLLKVFIVKFFTIKTCVFNDFIQPWTCPTCKKEDDGSPMIGCDKCPDWYHNICVGITTVPEGSWFCPKCSKDKVKKKSKSKKKV